MGEERMDLPQGTLDLLILKTLALEPQHGWAVSERLQQVSGQALQVGQGSLYPSLHRLERRAESRPSGGRRRTIDAPSTTSSHAPAASNSRPQPRTGDA